jgi:hypothetical protein
VHLPEPAEETVDDLDNPDKVADSDNNPNGDTAVVAK